MQSAAVDRGFGFDLLIVRHGQSEANAEGRMQGRFDSPLSATGREQARAIGRWLRDRRLGWDVAYTSPLARARETAELVAATYGGAPPVSEPLLCEIAAGALEGRLWTEILAEYPSYAARGATELGDFSEFGGESYDEVQARVNAFVDFVRGRVGDGRRRFLVVGHGGFNFHLVKRLICVPVPRVCILRMENGAVTLIHVESRRGTELGDVVFHVPLELMGAPVKVPSSEPPPGSAG